MAHNESTDIDRGSRNESLPAYLALPCVLKEREVLGTWRYQKEEKKKGKRKEEEKEPPSLLRLEKKIVINSI